MNKSIRVLCVSARSTSRLSKKNFNHFFTVKSQLTAGSVNMSPGLVMVISLPIIKHVFTVEFFFTEA